MYIPTSSTQDGEGSNRESTHRLTRPIPSPARQYAKRSGYAGSQLKREEGPSSVSARAETTPLRDAESPILPLSRARYSMILPEVLSGKSEADVEGQFMHRVHAAGCTIMPARYDGHAQPFQSPFSRRGATEIGEMRHLVSTHSGAWMSAAGLHAAYVTLGIQTSRQEMQEPFGPFAPDEKMATDERVLDDDTASSANGAESVEKTEMLFSSVECRAAHLSRLRRRSSGTSKMLTAFVARAALRSDNSQVNGLNAEPQNDEGRVLTTMSGSVSIASLLVNVGMIMEPYALAQCGLALGTLIFTLVSIVVLFNSFLMRRTLAICDALGERNADLSVFAELAFGEGGKKVVTAVFLMDLWAAQLTYYVIIAQCLRDLYEPMETTFAASGLLTVAMLYAPLSWITNFQKIGGLSIVTLLLALFFSGLSLETWPDPSYANFTWRNLPCASSMMVFAYGNLAVLPTILDRIPDSKRAQSISWGVFASFALYGLAATFCYLSYGEGVAPSFLNNVGKDRRGKRLPGISGSVLPVLSCVLIAIKLQVSFPLLVTPAVHSICDLLHVKRRNVMVSVMFVSITVMSAYIMRDHLAVLAAILGSFVTVPLVMLFPTALYWRLAPWTPTWTKILIVSEFIAAFLLAAVHLKPFGPSLLSTVYSVIA